MQDEVNEKVVALSIKTSKLTAEVLQKAMKAVLAPAFLHAENCHSFITPLLWICYAVEQRF